LNRSFQFNLHNRGKNALIVYGKIVLTCAALITNVPATSKSLSRILIVVLVALIAHPLDAATLITFDDLSPGTSYIGLGNGYAGLRWADFYVLDGSRQSTNTGYHIGVVSSNNVAFNVDGSAASLGCSAPFDFVSAYVTAAFDAQLQLRVKGLLGTNVLYDNTYSVNIASPTLINFQYLGVDQVEFSSTPSGIFVLDDITVAITNYPHGVNVQTLEVASIGHVWATTTPGNPVQDFFLDQRQTSGGGGVLQPLFSNFDDTNQFLLRISAPAGKLFRIHTPNGEPAFFYGSSELWGDGGIAGGANGPVLTSFEGLRGNPPDFSGSSSFISPFNGSFGFSQITSTALTNDLLFSAITFTGALSPSYTNSGTLSYTPGANARLLVSYSPSDLTDHGNFVSIIDQPTVQIMRGPNEDMVITFSGTLQSADSLNGTFSDVPGDPQGTYTVPQASLAEHQFFRARSN
jgi:hypothetical protein